MLLCKCMDMNCPNDHYDGDTGRMNAPGRGRPLDEHDQPMPISNENPSIHDLVALDIGERKLLGLQRYNSLLQANNGRDVLKDLYDELLDACCYIRQCIEERKIEKHKTQENPIIENPIQEKERNSVTYDAA